MIKYLVPLSLLFVLEGITLGLFLVAIPNYLTDHEILFRWSLIPCLVLAPFMLRGILAPIFDCLWYEKLGKRRSQLIVLLSGYGCLLYFVKIDPTDSTDLLFKMFYVIILLSFIDLCITAWIVESSQERGAIAQYIGILVGAFIGSFGFATFNSLTFCNTYLYATPKEIPMITLQDALGDLGLFSIGLAIMMIVMIREGASTQQNLWEIYRSQFNFTGNKHLVSLIFFLATFRIGLLPIDLAHKYLLIHYFSEGQIQFLQIVSFPIACIMPIYMAKLTSERLELRYIMILQIYKLLISFGLVCMIYFLEKQWNLPYRDLILNCCLIAGWLMNILNISLAFSFIYKISKSCVSATYVSILTTAIISQFVLAFILEQFMQRFYILWMIGIGIQLLFFRYVGSKITDIDQLECIEFSLDIDIKQERLLPHASELTDLS